MVLMSWIIQLFLIKAHLLFSPVLPPVCCLHLGPHLIWQSITFLAPISQTVKCKLDWLVFHTSSCAVSFLTSSPFSPLDPRCPLYPQRPWNQSWTRWKIKSCVKSFTYYKYSMCNICMSFVPTCDPGAPGDPGWPSSPFSPSLPGGPSRPGGPLWPRSPYQTTWIITAMDSDWFVINLLVKMYDIFTRYLETKKIKNWIKSQTCENPQYKS